MVIPISGSDGRCNDINYAHFQETVTSNTCVRQAESVNACPANSGFSSFVGDLYVRAQDSTTLVVGVASSSDYVNVQLNSVSYRNVATGEETSLSNPAATSYDLSTSTCMNALLSLAYHVEFSSAGAITAVKADLVVGNISQTAGTRMAFEQEFLVDFISNTSSTRSFESHNLQNRARSGNPGYIDGRPVLSGNVATSGTLTAISEDIGGLRLPFFYDQQGNCVPNDDTALAVDPAGVQVLFGHDMLLSCTISGLSMSAFQTLCNQDPSTSSTGIFPYYMNASKFSERIGVYGNSDPYNSDTSEWVAITIDAPTSAGTFDSSTLLCGGGGFVSSMNVEFLVSSQGAHVNPQKSIVAARVKFERSDLGFTATAPAATGDTMDVMITTSVTFVKLDDTVLDEYIPPAPPLLPVLPYDIFYPFLIGGSTAAVPSILGFVASLACLVWLLE